MEIFSAARMPDGLRARRLEETDYEKGFLELMGTLTQVGEISQEKFTETFNLVQKNPDIYFIVVFEEIDTGKLAGAGTLLVEQKFIRQCGKVGHIEDIVISPDFQGRRLGKVLIELLLDIGKQQNCYKTILDCSEDVKGFYDRCGFSLKGHFMAVYYDR